MWPFPLSRFFSLHNWTKTYQDYAFLATSEEVVGEGGKWQGDGEGKGGGEGGRTSNKEALSMSLLNNADNCECEICKIPNANGHVTKKIRFEAQDQKYIKLTSNIYPLRQTVSFDLHWILFPLL